MSSRGGPPVIQSRLPPSSRAEGEGSLVAGRRRSFDSALRAPLRMTWWGASASAQDDVVGRFGLHPG